MQRVLVIGSPGAGKSTLSRELARRTGLPVIHLDAEYWRAGWIGPDTNEWIARTREIVAGERWIVDGNYGSTLGRRLSRADTVIWLDYSTPLCLWRVIRRVVTSYGRTRPDMAEGCPERFDLDFLGYVLRFRREWRERNLTALSGFHGRVLRFERPAQARAWLESLG